MSTVIDLKEIEKRAKYAAYQDGLMEIASGLLLIFLGGALASDTISLLIVFAVLIIFFGNRVIEWFKKRFIYPRAGYVKLPEDPNVSGKGIAIAALVFIVLMLGAMTVSMLLLGTDAGADLFMTYIFPPTTGIMLAIGPYWLGQTYGLVRWYVWAALFVLGGIVIPVFRIASGYEAVGLLCIVMGLLIFTTGVVMFVRFIRKYSPEPIEVEEVPNAG